MHIINKFSRPLERYVVQPARWLLKNGYVLESFLQEYLFDIRVFDCVRMVAALQQDFIIEPIKFIDSDTKYSTNNFVEGLHYK